MTLSDTSLQEQLITPNNVEALAKVNNKGQVTIPNQIREFYNIQKNTQLFISINENNQELYLSLVESKAKLSKPMKISRTYRFTIPKELRKQLQLEGTTAVFKISENQVIIIEKATQQFVTRAERLWIAPNKTFAHLCYLAKNLYNKATYIIRQEYFKTKLWIRYEELNSLIKGSPNYRSLPIATSQQILRHVDSTWDSYFKSHKDWLTNPHKYTGEPRLPKYKPKNGQFLLIFTNQQVRYKKGLFKLPQVIRLEIKTRLHPNTKFLGARIIPKGTGYILEVLYSKQIPIISNTRPKRIVGTDIGLDNLITNVNNIGERPIIVKGGIVKAIDQYFNKELAKLQSMYDKQNIKTGKKRKKITDERDRKLFDFFHKISRMYIDWCIVNQIDTIIIGRNKGWKQMINLGKKTNQTFVSIPFYRFLQMLEYKAEDAGIRVIFTREDYTSKCSFLDQEPIQKHQKYKGTRIFRGLFKSAKGILINSDVNGGYNIIVHVIPKAFQSNDSANGIEDVWLHPVRWSLDRQRDKRMTPDKKETENRISDKS